MLRIVEGDESSLTSHLQCHKWEREEVDAGTVYSKVDELRVIGEDAHQRFRYEEDQKPDGEVDEKSAQEDEADTLGDALRFLGAIVVAHDVLTGTCKAVVRKAHYFAHGICQAHGTNI